MSELNDILRVVQLTNQFQAIKREVYHQGQESKENDAEHSFQLVIVAWYIIEANKLSLDLNKVIKYALVHDLVEVYAGDTFIYGDEAKIASKQQRETEAQKKLQETFPRFADLHQTIEAYETRKDPESIFVYELDKILPIINIYLDKGRMWKKHQISLEMLQTNKEKKIRDSVEIKKYFVELVKILKEQETELFTKKEKN